MENINIGNRIEGKGASQQAGGREGKRKKGERGELAVWIGRLIDGWVDAGVGGYVDRRVMNVWVDGCVNG